MTTNKKIPIKLTLVATAAVLIMCQNIVNAGCSYKIKKLGQFGATMAPASSGIWLSTLKQVKHKTGSVPPRIELHLKNKFIEGGLSRAKPIISAYCFSKTSENKNFVKLNAWKGEKVQTIETFKSVWVLVYHNKIDDSTKHNWCISMMENLEGAIYGDSSL